MINDAIAECNLYTVGGRDPCAVGGDHEEADRQPVALWPGGCRHVE